MNGVNYPLTAATVANPAGMYTADCDGVRASWVMRPDGSAEPLQFFSLSTIVILTAAACGP